MSCRYRASSYFKNLNKTSFSDIVESKAVEAKLTIAVPRQVDEDLYRDFHSAKTEIMEEAIVYGQMTLEDITPGSVTLQLRPMTDHATQFLLKAKKNNRLLEMIFGMLKRINISDKMVSSQPMEIRVQVNYASATIHNIGEFQNDLNRRRRWFHTIHFILLYLPEFLSELCP